MPTEENSTPEMENPQYETEKQPSPMDGVHQVSFLTLAMAFMGFFPMFLTSGKEIYAVIFAGLAIVCLVLREKFKN